jgi:hypothetical protein
MVDDAKMVGGEESPPTGVMSTEAIVTDIHYHAPDGPVRGLRRPALQDLCKKNKINIDGSEGKNVLVALIEELQAAGKKVKGLPTVK